MPSCKYCKKRKESNQHLSFHKFPKEDALRRQWLINMGQPGFQPTCNLTLCSDHFERDCFEFRPNFTGAMSRLKRHSIPTIFLHNIENETAGEGDQILSQARKKKKLSDDTTSKLQRDRIPLQEVTSNISREAQRVDGGMLSLDNENISHLSTSYQDKQHKQTQHPIPEISTHQKTALSPIQLAVKDLNQILFGMSHDHIYAESNDSMRRKLEMKERKQHIIVKEKKMMKQQYKRALTKIERCEKAIQKLREIPDFKSDLHKLSLISTYYQMSERDLLGSSSAEC